VFELNIRLYSCQQEVSKNVQSILNKITPKNADELIERFTTLPINTIERMENAVDLVFKRVIYYDVISKIKLLHFRFR